MNLVPSLKIEIFLSGIGLDQVAETFVEFIIDLHSVLTLSERLDEA